MAVQGLANELNREGACDRAIYPDENIAITSCAIEGYYEEGVRDHSSRLPCRYSNSLFLASPFMCSVTTSSRLKLTLIHAMAIWRGDCRETGASWTS